MPSKTVVASPLKWHGGKSYLADRIVRLMPPHLHYVEPYAGGLSVLLAKDPEGVSEVVNDLNLDLMNFWAVLADPVQFDQFRRFVEATPFSEVCWDSAREGRRNPLVTEPHRRAWAFFVHCRQSLAGRMESFAPLSRTRVRRGMNEQASAWLSAVDGLPAVHARLKRVVVLNRDALDVIRQQDGPDTLFYLDPPYVPESRTAADVYAHEMTADQHTELLGTLAGLKGKWLLSGYPNKLYDSCLRDLPHWRVDFDLPNNAAGGKAKRRMTECVWMNYPPPADSEGGEHD
jgi:DNA adenine methylase